MRILVISDLHAPFNQPGAVDFLAELRREVKPEAVVCIGDEIDAHGWGRWNRDPDAPGQGEELELAKATLAQVYKLFPKVMVCRSNHGDRAMKTALRAGLPSAFVREASEVLDAPVGWKWQESWTVDNIAFIHGEGFSGMNAALAAARSNRCNTVIGHVHSFASVQYHANRFDTIFGMNVGCLVDPTALAMQYAHHGPNRQCIGTGVILDGLPYIVPFKGAKQ